MAGRRGLLLALLFLLHFPPPEAFKILTVSFIGGSHYLMMDEISHILHSRGHEVRMFLRAGNLMIPGLKNERPKTYQITTWSASQDYIHNYKKWFADVMEELLKGRGKLRLFFDLMNHLAAQCRVILNESETLNSLKDEKFDIAVIDAFNPCSFLVLEKLGLPFVAVFTGTFVNGPQAGLPSPLSYVPVHNSQLSDQMDFWDRVKNCLMSLVSPVVENQVQARFENVIKEYFPAGSRPVLSELYLKAELWIYNTDFSFEFARPLLPNTVYIGGLLAKPAKPLSQELEDFIAKSGEDGFIIVTLGSMISSVPVLEVLKEMNTAFSHLPQGVIWRCQRSKWPEELQLASNVKLADWLPQNDLLGHPMARLLVTHGGLNSLMQAIYHGVPVVGIPLFGDQHDNMVRVEAKKMGLALQIDQLTADKFTHTMKQVIEDKRYKSAVMNLRTIHHSHPLPPDQRLARWIEHVLKARGGAHLQPYAFQQPWYQQHSLDVLLFLAGSVLGLTYFCIKLIKAAAFKYHSLGKQKQT